MLNGLYSAATAVNSLEQQQQVLAQNLSHVNTPGFRAQTVSFAALLPQPGTPTISRAMGHGTRVSQTKTDFSPGSWIRTERELDVAIDGDGFFELESKAGPLYTRAGIFFVGQDGDLVASNGMPVAGDGGRIQVPTTVTPDQIRITQEGTVMAAGQNIGQLKVVKFANNQQLQRRGDTMFSAGAALPEPSDARLVQGVREAANVNATEQLVQMIATVRHHEAALRTLRSISETLQQHTRG